METVRSVDVHVVLSLRASASAEDPAPLAGKAAAVALRARARLTRGRGAGARRLPGACANAAPRGGRGLPPARRRPSLQFRKCAESAVRAARTRGAEPSAARRAWVARTGSLHVARHVAERSAPGALEPTAAVAEAVSSLTIVDAFIVAGESPPPPPPALRRRFICSFPDCSANYNKAWKLEAHLYKHTGERPFVCDYEGCGKSFVRDYHLSRHALIHTGEKPFVCPASGCEQKFNTKSNLKKHFERKHENQQKQYVCSFEGCTRTFRKHQQLKTHQCQHTNEPLFRCTHEGCGRHFASPSGLKRHGKVHDGYVCQKGCSLVAKTWTELLKHMREDHREEIVCEVCQKTFKRKDYLKQHLKIHAPERDMCRCPREGCGRTYATVFNLQSHILAFHEEWRPFLCEQGGCGKTFATRQSLMRHAAVHDPDRKKMTVKVKGREKRSLASHLSGYIPPKRGQAAASPAPPTGEPPPRADDGVLSSVAVFTLS